MRRKRMSMRSSRKSYKKYQGGLKANIQPAPMRGGWRM